MNKRPDDKFHWLALHLVPGLGNNTFRNLLDRFGQPEAILDASFSELMHVKGVRGEVAKRIARREFGSDPEMELTRVERASARIISYLDPTYPAPLREVSSPPMVLYVKGKDISVDQAFVAVVGSRHPTHYGQKSAEMIAMGLAKRGVGVVSGMAMGIDSAAHKGCLMGEGFTVAVLGTGIDVIYPIRNRKLFDQIVERGTILSEFPMGSPPEPRNFPIRNRIISGLSRGVAVIEATMKSGSLITAAQALDQGRDVFAVPGSIQSFKSTGTHFLIKQGARLIENAEDILSEMGVSDTNSKGSGEMRDHSQEPLNLSEPEKKIYEILGTYPMHADEIVRLVGMEAGEVLSILMKMELMGLVRQLTGKMFVR